MTDGDDDGFEGRPTPTSPHATVTPPTDSDRIRHRKTYPHGTPIIQSDEDRALARRSYHAPAAPEFLPDEDVTSPRDLFEPERTHARRASVTALELANDLRRRGIDPHLAAATLALELTETKLRERQRQRKSDTDQREVEKRLEAFLSVQPGTAKFAQLDAAVAGMESDIAELRERTPGEGRFDELAKIVAGLESAANELAPVRRGLRWLQASVVLVVVGIGGWLYARGGKETAVDIRIEELREARDEFKRQLESLSARMNERERHDVVRDQHP